MVQVSICSLRKLIRIFKSTHGFYLHGGIVMTCQRKLQLYANGLPLPLLSTTTLHFCRFQEKFSEMLLAKENTKFN